MAAEVGTETANSASTAATTIASSSKNTTSGNLLIACVKWESALTINTTTPATDTAGNTWQIARQRVFNTTSEPGCAILYAKNITGNAANVVTVNFSTSAIWRVLFVSEWSGLDTSSPEDGTPTDNQGTGTSYSSGAITLSTSGLVIALAGGYTATTGKTAGGTPTFSLGDTSVSDSFPIRLITSSGSKTPGASVSTGSDRWVMVAAGFKDASGGGGATAKFTASIIG